MYAQYLRLAAHIWKQRVFRMVCLLASGISRAHGLDDSGYPKKYNRTLFCLSKLCVLFLGASVQLSNDVYLLKMNGCRQKLNDFTL